MSRRHRLSAYLYEYTRQNQSLAAAEASANFIINLLFNGKIILDSTGLNKCDFRPDNQEVSYNSGFAIEGLSVLADITKNTTLQIL